MSPFREQGQQQRSGDGDEWDPSQDDRLCVWEATQHLIRALDSGGEASAAALLSQLKNLPGQGELAANCRALAYRLYNHCEKTKQTEEARAYNGLVIAWTELQRLATSQASASAVRIVAWQEEIIKDTQSYISHHKLSH